MKKTILFSMLAIFCPASVCIAASMSVPWWMRPTICQISQTDCYDKTEIGTGKGFCSNCWDAIGNCRGMKKICADALSDSEDGVSVPMGRADIASGRGISTDFDVSKLRDADDCFGERKTTANGTQVLIDGKYVNLWCKGVLSDSGFENVQDIGQGEVVTGAQPTCAQLSPYGYVGVLNKNKKCYGEHYDTRDFFIECGDSGMMPTRIIVLNKVTDTQNDKVPVTIADADKIFDEMQSVSSTMREKHFFESD